MRTTWWIGALLFLSLATNAFLAGWILSPQAAEPSSRAPAFRQLMERVRTLPEPERDEARQIIRAYRSDLRARARALRQARQEVRALLTDSEYSRAAADAQFERVRQRTAELQSLAQRMMLDIADKLPAEERARLADNWGRRP